MTTTLSDAQLIEHIANAYVTHARAGGHSKAAANREVWLSLTAEAVSRGLTIPAPQELSTIGKFNGPGAV